MSALLLSPYNDSMRLGAGYNSFLQTPCLGNAVTISDALITTPGARDGRNGTSQTVAYSASFVEKMSEVVRAMNISAGSSIRTGSVNTSAGNSTIDEAKFAESDLNAVVFVKVVNQTRTIQDKVDFNEITMKNMNNETFHSTYGDTFISGFIEGGELHGIVSIKILDASKKHEIKKQLKSQFNGSSSGWSLTSAGELSSIMSQTEVTITVNYSGGGTIKEPSQEWTLESLMAAASAFPDNVANCPQRTSAVLSRYNTIPSFVKWMNTLTSPIVVRRYEGVQRYTSELLDTFMEYKSNLLLLNDAIRHPELYQLSSVEHAVPVKLEAMVEERKQLKREMEKMVQKIELLDTDPEKIVNFKDADDIPAPELQRSRLPMKRNLDQDHATQNLMKSLLGGLNIVEGVSDTGEQVDSMSTLEHDVEVQSLTTNITTLTTQLELSVREKDELEGNLRKEIEQQKKAHEETKKALAEKDKLGENLKTEIERLKEECEKTKEGHRVEMQTLGKANEQAEKDQVLRNSEHQKQLLEANSEIQRLNDSIPEINVISIMFQPNEVVDHLFTEKAKNKVADLIKNRSSTVINPDMFGGFDPHPGSQKWARIIYQRRGERVLGVEGWEYTTVKFW